MQLVFTLFELVLWLGGIVLLFPVALLFVECLVAPRRLPITPLPNSPLPRTTVLIPAHNEEVGIGATLMSVHAAAFPQLDVLVVADNCTDATAALARQQGAHVIERNDSTHIGKGYALAFGVDYIKTQPPDVLIVLDADCIVQPDALEHLARCAADTVRPVQSIYTLLAVPGALSKTAISNFAFLVKNRVRPSGLARLGAPCVLTGSGMAFPRTMLPELSRTAGHLSEDMWLSVLFTCAGHAPRLCRNAFVYGQPPRREDALKMQRARWERGHLQTMVQGIPRLVRASFLNRSWEPLWLAWELSVPPLALLVSLVSLLTFGSALGWMLGLSARPFALGLLNLGLLLSSVLTAWYKFGRSTLPAQTLLTVPTYVLWKIPLYLNTLFRTQLPWTRTVRDPSPRGKR